jgi:ATP-dependent DNA helicase RecG
VYKEDNETEYKLANNDIPNDIWSTYSAFANTLGGVIVLGVEENPKGVFNAVGIQEPLKLIDDFWNTITSIEKVNKNILSDENVFVDELDGKTVIVIDVPEADYKLKPIMVKPRKQWLAYKRLGTGDRVATEEQYRYMVANAQSDMDTMLLEGFDTDDLNLADVHRYKNAVIEHSGETRFADMSDEIFLKEIGVFKRKRPSKEYAMTVGGLLFFGKYDSIIDHYANFQLDYFKKNNSLDTDWSDRISTGDMSYPEMNVYSFYTTVFERMTSTLPEAFQVGENSQRLPYRADLSRAIRESLVNMLMHPYYGSQVPLKVTEYPDYIEFYNPGDMRVLPTDFIVGGTSKPRNSSLAVLFRKIGIAEKAGSGGPRIFDVVNKYNLRTPDIINNDEDTLIRLWKTDLVNSLKDLSPDEKKIIEYLVSEGAIRKQIAKSVLKLTEYSFTNALKTLQESNLVEKIGNGPSTRYILVKNSEADVFSNKKFIRALEDSLRNNHSR